MQWGGEGEEDGSKLSRLLCQMLVTVSRFVFGGRHGSYSLAITEVAGEVVGAG